MLQLKFPTFHHSEDCPKPCVIQRLYGPQTKSKQHFFFENPQAPFVNLELNSVCGRLLLLPGHLPEGRRTDVLSCWITYTQGKTDSTTATWSRLSKQINLKNPNQTEIFHYSQGKIIVCCDSYRGWHILEESGGNISVFKHRQVLITQQSTADSLRIFSSQDRRAQEQSAKVIRMTKMEEHDSFQIQKCLMALKCYFNGDHMLTFKHNSTALLNMVVFIFLFYFTSFCPTLPKTIK